jgi:hypothetical protein
MNSPMVLDCLLWQARLAWLTVWSLLAHGTMGKSINIIVMQGIAEQLRQEGFDANTGIRDCNCIDVHTRAGEYICIWVYHDLEVSISHYIGSNRKNAKYDRMDHYSYDLSEPKSISKIIDLIKTLGGPHN